MPETDYLTVTRAAYDTVASDNARLLAGALDRMPWDRAVLALFAELVSRDRLGPVAVGCGPGRVTGYLHHLGLNVFGVDLSPGMLAVARQALPGLRFVEGSMTALDLPDSSLAGLVLADPHCSGGRPRRPHRVLPGAGPLRTAAARLSSRRRAATPSAGVRPRHLARHLSDGARPARPAAGHRWSARTCPRRAGPRRPGDRAAGALASPQRSTTPS